MKKLLIFVLVMILLMVLISPALAGNGNGGGGGGNGNGGNGGGNGRGNGNGRNGNTNNQQRLGTSENGYGWQFGINVITGAIVAIEGDADSGLVTLKVYGGKDISLYGSEVKVETDSSTRFLSKLGWEITPIAFEDIKQGDTASIAIGSDGTADRITVGVECLCIP